MGVCQSCLGQRKKRGQSNRARGISGAGLEEESSETSRLLRDDDGRKAADYGSSTTDTNLLPIQDLNLDEDDETPEQVQAYLARAWRETSDKLIDITHVTSPLEVDRDTSTTISSDIRNISQDYQRFFHDTFHTARRPDTGHNDAKEASDNAHTSANRPIIQKDTFLPPPPSSQNEQDWLREIILRDPQDKSWDCNRVQKIGKPLMMSFEEAVTRDEKERLSLQAGGSTSEHASAVAA